MRRIFCCGLRLWCVLDTLLHWVPSDRFHHSRLAWWVCDRHEEWIWR